MDTNDLQPPANDTQATHGNTEGTILSSYIHNLVKILQGIDETAPDAELNATTISDNNGERIIL